MIAPNSIEQLLNAAVIEDVVGDYVSLKRAGSRYKGLCPFHDEKTPSFVVTPTLGIYKCFGCQKGGNALNFLMEVENMSYVEAARSLAKRYGIELVETGVADSEEYRESQKRRENLQVVLDYAAEFFSHNLTESEEGRTIGMPYFRERGFTPATIAKWGLGYSPSEWEALADKAAADGYTLENLELAGLVRKKENGRYFDLFRNRVIFPIHSVSGKVIAFAGRKMTSTDPAPKYVNSPETDLYKKSDILYGIYQAKNSIKHENKVYLTEGYTDVITLSQHGVENVVASSGTALTPGQIKLLRRFTPNITVVYDGDKAGIKASLRGINLLLAEDLNVRVVPLPEGEDPDSYCQKLGAAEFRNYLEAHEENFIFFKARLLLEGIGNDPIKRTEAIRDILDSLSEIRDPLKRNALNKELAAICQMDEQLLAGELSKMVKSKITGRGTEIIEELRQITRSVGVEMHREPFTDDSQEFSFLRLMLLNGDKPFEDEQNVFEYALGEIRTDDLVEFHSPLAAKVFEVMLAEYPNFPGQSFFVQHPDPEIASWAAGVLSGGYELSRAWGENFIYVTHENDNYKQDLVSIIVHLRRKKLDNLIKQTMEKLKDESLNHEEVIFELNYLSETQARIAQEFGWVVLTLGH